MVVDSAIVLHQVKRLGWVLDETGRNTGTLVPYGQPSGAESQV